MTDRTSCAIVGGGPAGMVLGLLLARAGVAVTVLEKHGDFLRDFRGDTVHPTTLRLLDELGLFDRFDALPHSKVRRMEFPRGDGRTVTLADFDRLRGLEHRYVAMVPQWDLLNLLADAGRAESSYTLRMQTEVTGLLWEGGRVVGVRHEGPEGTGEVRADLVVACDGRWSTARQDAGLVPKEYPVGFDVWWFRVPTEPGKVENSLLPRTTRGRALIGIPREGYLQVAYLGRKGTDSQLRARGIEALRQDVVDVLPDLAGHVDQLASMDDVKHLDVRVNRLSRWHVDGLLCIGDAAHAMSPVGGVGINVAVQDAVATARLLATPLREGRVTDDDLAAVRRRRRLPVAVTQALQRRLQHAIIEPVVRGDIPSPPKALLDLVARVPQLSAIPAYLVGVGVRPEHAPAFARRAPGARPA